MAQEGINSLTPELLGMLVEQGFCDVVVRGSAGICAVRPMLFTAALVVGIGPHVVGGRYCYESMDEARASLRQWDGHDDPPGRWIKFKSVRGERLGPGFAGDARSAAVVPDERVGRSKRAVSAGVVRLAQ